MERDPPGGAPQRVSRDGAAAVAPPRSATARRRQPIWSAQMKGKHLQLNYAFLSVPDEGSGPR